MGSSAGSTFSRLIGGGNPSSSEAQICTQLARLWHEGARAIDTIVSTNSPRMLNVSSASL